MSLPRYAEYKGSGVPWLGEVPTHWEIAPLKRMLDIQNGSDHKHVETDEGHPVIGSGGPFAYASQYLYDGESVLLGRKGTVDKPLYVTGKFWTVDTMYWTKISPDACGKFCYYAALTIPFDLYSTNTALPSMTKGVLSAHPIARPSHEEQSAIAAFLDRETGKIDALIAEQEKLLTLLAEKRQATISHAVTRGINPNAPMKDSGVPWLGEVPAHWSVVALKRIVSVPITDGPHETPIFLDDGVPFVSAEAVSGGEVNFSKIRGFISLEEHLRFSEKYVPALHDIYMVKSGATTGVTAIVETEMEFNIWSPLAAIRCDPEVVYPYFVLNFMRSRNFQEAVALNWSFGTQQNIGMGVLGNLPVAVPPVSEQREIASTLDERSVSFSVLKNEAERAIVLLKERRSALIAAAVTGKIDVRSAQVGESV